MTLAVLIPTFRRPHLLRAALDSLEAQTRRDIQIFVADNDVIGSGAAAAEVWAAACGRSVSAIRVSQRGISANRNAGLQCAFLDPAVEAVAMLDDDAVADARWIETIFRHLPDSGAVLLGGPTIYTFPDTAPVSIRSLEMFGVPYEKSGPVPCLRSTNNCVVTRAFFDKNGPAPFHPDFAFTGGEDTHLFRSSAARGERMFWMADARVIEPVPSERCSEEWVLERHRLSAINSARVSRMILGGPAGWRRELGLAARETAGGLYRLATGRQPRLVTRQRFAGAAGRVSGLFGRKPVHSVRNQDACSAEPRA